MTVRRSAQDFGRAAVQSSAADAARRLMRACDRATLATAMPAGSGAAAAAAAGSGGAPYASLVLAAARHDAAPVLLLSNLAQHTVNLKADARVSLLFDGTAGCDDPLTGPRVTVLGRIAPSDDPADRARFLARHPSAAFYADFADFRFYRVAVERAHLVAGFGRIDWIDAAALLFDAGGATALAAAEPGIVRHMNEDHADAVALYATRLLGRSAAGEGEKDWQLTGVDPEGADLRRGGEVARLDFPGPVRDPDGARTAFVRLVKEARGGSDG
ncbi:MAG TPA: DUF2470 domain-containing protein [Stellaceae bacterium]